MTATDMTPYSDYMITESLIPILNRYEIIIASPGWAEKYETLYTAVFHK